MGTYLGSINKTKFEELPKKEQIELLISQEVCTGIERYETTINKNELLVDLGSRKFDLKPSEKLVNDFSNYILREYEYEISLAYASFFNQFEDRIYGLDIIDQKKEALLQFNEICKTVDVSQINLMKREKQKGLVEKIKKIGRLEKLNHIRKTNMSNLCELPIAIEYLYGNIEFLTSATFKDLDNFKKVIDFETKLKILVNLNDRFQFEEDFIFGEKGRLKEIFNTSKHIFKSFDAFEYSYNKIENFEDVKPTNLGSLYDALKDLDLIQGKKSDFIKYVEDVHRIKLSSIKYFPKGRNLEHDRRVENITKELLKYSEEK